MICSNCGGNVGSSEKFCPVCGCAVSQTIEENYDSPTEFGEIPGNQNTNAASQPEVGYTQSAMADYGYQNSSEALYDKQPKKKNPKKLLIPVVAIVLVVAIAFGAWGIFLAVNPQVRIARALEKTLFSAKSFAVDVSYDGETIGEGYVSFGKTTFTTDFYVEIGDYYTIACDDGMLLMPVEDAYISADLPEVFSELQNDLDDIISMFTNGGDADVLADQINDRYDTDISPEKVLEWAENLIKNNRINEDVISEMYDMVLVPVAVKELDLDEKDIPNYKKMKKIISNAFIKGIDSKAFKVTDTDRKDGIKYYECELNTIELYRGVAEYLLDCKDLEALLDAEFDGRTGREVLEDALEEVEDFIDSDDYDEDDCTVEFAVGIKNGYLVAVEYDEFEVKLTEINKKHDAKNDYEDLEDEAYNVVEISSFEDLISNLGVFAGAKEPSYDYYEDDYYGYY